MKPTATMWRICRRAARLEVAESLVRTLKGMNHQDFMSEANMAFVEACHKWRKGGMPLKNYFLLRYQNRLRALRRRNAIRHRVLPRVYNYNLERTQAREHVQFDREELFDKLDKNERRLLEVILNYDQRRIKSSGRRDGHWPVQAIMQMAKRKMARWGWDDRKMRRVFNGIRQVLIESRESA